MALVAARQPLLADDEPAVQHAVARRQDHPQPLHVGELAGVLLADAGAVREEHVTALEQVCHEKVWRQEPMSARLAERAGSGAHVVVPVEHARALQNRAPKRSEPRHGGCDLGQPVMSDPNTARIRREDLRDLLDTEKKSQRTTARMPAVTLTGLLTLRDEALPPLPAPRPQGTNHRLKTSDRPPDRAASVDEVRAPEISPLVVSFRQPAPSPWNLDQWPSPFVIALSCSATLLLVSLLLRIL